MVEFTVSQKKAGLSVALTVSVAAEAFGFSNQLYEGCLRPEDIRVEGIEEILEGLQAEAVSLLRTADLKLQLKLIEGSARATEKSLASARSCAGGDVMAFDHEHVGGEIDAATARTDMERIVRRWEDP